MNAPHPSIKRIFRNYFYGIPGMSWIYIVKNKNINTGNTCYSKKQDCNITQMIQGV
jgi:hypothetical protein